MRDPRHSPHTVESDPHLEEDHYAPSRTMVQGTQEYGVEHGHEQEDIQGRALLRWWLGLGGFILVCQLLMWAMFGFLHRRELTTGESRVPPFADVQQAPPEPRLIPNPVDARLQPFEPIQGPLEYGREQRTLERRQMEALGLWDTQTDLPRIPQEIQQQVIAETTGGQVPAPQIQRRPTDGSGGLLMEENPLR
jgi:hypothetical protein